MTVAPSSRPKIVEPETSKVASGVPWAIPTLSVPESTKTIVLFDEDSAISSSDSSPGFKETNVSETVMPVIPPASTLTVLVPNAMSVSKSPWCMILLAA